jgi:alpha-D-ribose 1-methylphosphonate 5-triphosphate synthase subunit PhnL
MLRVENLSKTFTIHGLGARKIVGFRNVSFHVEPDKALALSGPSGSGKSSILKCIYRTYKPTAGCVRFASRSLGEIDMATASDYTVLHLRKKEIGYVTQFLKVLPRISAVDVVAEPLINGRDSRQTARRKAMALLERLHIPSSLFDMHPLTFSGGEQQRVNIARAIIGKPRLLLLDEPTASLDRGLMGIVIDLLLELRNQGSAIVMIFHDYGIVDSLADEIYEMPGQEIQDG